MTKIFVRISRPSLRQGLIFGVILGVVQIAYGFLASLIVQEGIQPVLSIIGLAFFVVFGFLAGQRAARETGKFTSGLLAGLWTGLIGSLLYQLIPFVNGIVHLSDIVQYYQSLIRLNPSKYPGVAPSSFSSTDALINITISLLSGVLTYTLIVLVGSALGGFRGKEQAIANQPGEEYKEALFVAPHSKGSVTDDAMK